jgi:hypothetical protein
MPRVPPQQIEIPAGSTSRRTGELLALFVIVLAGLAIRLFFFTGTIGNDDLPHAYAAYFLFSPDAEKHAVVNWPDDALYRRMAINVPLWLSMRALGVHEWSLALTPLVFSLAGSVFMYLTLRLLAGTAAGLAAAAVWACLPAQVYQATLWLQDDVFSGTFAAFLFFFIAALDSRGRRRLLYGLAAGMALAYLQYAKETACLLVVPTAVVLLVAALRDRRALWTGGAVLLGFAGLHALAGLLFWHLNGSFWWYWAEAVAAVQSKASLSVPVPEMLKLFWQRFCQKWLLGYAVVVFPLFAGAAFLSRRAPHRLLLALLLGVQLFVWYGATCLTTGQDRYAQQLSAPYVAISVLGVVLMANRLATGRRRRLFLTSLAACGLVAATAAALRRDRQQFQWGRMQSLRLGFDFYRAMAAPHEPIYTFETPARAASFTRRACYQFAGFESPAGGFRDWHPGETPDSGWAVLSFLESRLGGENLSIPANWLLEYEGGMRPERTRPGLWTRVYHIVPPALAEGKPATLFRWPSDKRIWAVGDGASYTSAQARDLDSALVVQVSNSLSSIRFQDTTVVGAPLKYGTWVPPGQRELRFSAHVRATGVARFQLGFLRRPVSCDGHPQPPSRLYFMPITVAHSSGELNSTVAACPTGEYVVPILRVWDTTGEVLDAQLQVMGL